MGDTSFNGAVVLDARQVGTTPTFYNDLVGSGSSLSAWKDTVYKYLTSLYPGPDIKQGEQLGYVTGLSAGQVFPLIDAKYSVGDTITTLVYDGTVRARDDFLLSLWCKQPITSGPVADRDPNPTCETTATAKSKYIYRDPAPSSGFFSGGAACNYSGAPFIGDRDAYAAGIHIPSTTELYPAKYIVRLEQATASQTVNLTARISGPNPGAGAGFGGLKVRWNNGPWQSPDVVYPVTLPANTAVDVKLEVIQTETESRTCTTPTGDVTRTVPKHVYGAHTIQVTGRGSSNRHSVYGSLGMRSRASTSASDFVNFDAGDYFLSFAGDPVGIIRGSGELDALLQFMDANSDPATETVWDFASLPSAGAATITGLPIGATAAVVAGPQGDPVMRITVPDGTTAGDYVIDVQWNSILPPVHSSRFYLRVTDGSPSIDSWVVVLCTARFSITHLDTNEMRGRAISGCIDPATNPAALLSTSRIGEW